MHGEGKCPVTGMTLWTALYPYGMAQRRYISHGRRPRRRGIRQPTPCLDMSTAWMPVSEDKDIFQGRDRATGELKWTGTRVDLIFGSDSQLRAIAEVYACDDSQNKFIQDFVSAWNKVMNADRFDLKSNQ